MKANVSFILFHNVELVFDVKRNDPICVPCSDLFLKFDIPPLQFTVLHIYILSLYAAINNNQ